MNRGSKFVCALALAAAGCSSFAQATTTTETTSTTITKTTHIKETVSEPKPWSPLKICVLPFTTADIKGQKRFLNQANSSIAIPPQCTLNDKDRKSINSVMQGFVRLIDAWDSSKTGDANRFTQIQDNERANFEARELYLQVVRGPSRPIVIGADYLEGALGQYPDVFQTIDSGIMEQAIVKAADKRDFPKEMYQDIAKYTGATHLIRSTVSDIRSSVKKFQGYETQIITTVYQLDVIVKLVDLSNGRTVFSTVATGSVSERQTPSSSGFDDSKFQTMMKSALEHAAADLHRVSKPGPDNRISAAPDAPSSFRLTVTPAGRFFFKPESAEIYIDGALVGKGGTPFSVTSGKHQLEIKASGYKTFSTPIVVNEDSTISPQLVK